MIWNRSLSGPELNDRMQQAMAAGLFMLAIMSALNGVQVVVSEPTAEVLDTIVGVIAVIMILTILPIFVMRHWRLRRANERRSDCELADQGFIAEAVQKAMAKSWMATMLALVGVMLFQNHLPALEAKFYIHMFLAFVVGSFSVVFFYLNRPSADEHGAE